MKTARHVPSNWSALNSLTFIHVRLHIDAGCKLEDKSTDVSKSWSISQLLRTLPRLTHLTFIAQHNLPNRHGSLEWAGSNEVLRISPQVQSLSLRMDSFTTSDFFDSLEKDSLALRRLNIWHRPTLSLNPASESWSIISFESPKKILKLGHAVRTMTKAGLEWPTIENQQRDLWLKLKALSRLDLFGEHEDEDSSDDLFGVDLALLASDEMHSLRLFAKIRAASNNAELRV
ncbi:hypothetical protein KEM48_014269 [Puccinia striiformis f. sp. tritici PST-130]|nr:hypothetical protein KEM48_014269 [Puccinia striiformis f. sp. tritici PST-130]